MKPEHSPQQKDKRSSMLGWGAVIIISAAVMVAFLIVRSRNNTTLIAASDEASSMARIVESLEAGQVQRLTVQGDYMTAILADDTAIEARKESTISAVESLQLLGASPDSLKGVPLIVSDPRVGADSIFGLIMIILPFAFIGLLIYRFSRQSPDNGPFSMPTRFGRSNPRVVTGTAEKGARLERPTVTFSDVAGAELAKLELQEVVEFLEESGQIYQARRQNSQGRADGRPAGNGQNPHGQSGGRRSEGALLLYLRL